jgi:hypothetical protein
VVFLFPDSSLNQDFEPLPGRSTEMRLKEERVRRRMEGRESRNASSGRMVTVGSRGLGGREGV